VERFSNYSTLKGIDNHKVQRGQQELKNRGPYSEQRPALKG